MSAMLTLGIVEATKPAAPRVAGEAPAAAPVSAAPAADPVCTGAAWPYLPETCLRAGSAASDGEPRRPVRVIEERRPAAPFRAPGRVSVG